VLVVPPFLPRIHDVLNRCQRLTRAGNEQFSVNGALLDRCVPVVVVLVGIDEELIFARLR
jgi:hypothetical protein